MKFPVLLLLLTSLYCSQSHAQQGSGSFTLDSTQLDVKIIRVYASGDKGTSTKQAMHHALVEAQKLCRDKGFSHFYIVDSQTTYRQNQTSRQKSYTRRGTVKSTGIQTLNHEGELTGSTTIDIDYNDTAGARSTEHTSSGTIVSSNNNSLPTSPNKALGDQTPWVAITIQMTSNKIKVDKPLYPAAQTTGNNHE